MSYIRKCCVSGCNSTNKTHRLFNIPKNDKLRELWLSFLIPNNVKLSGLSKEQLVNKFVCQNHFDRYQFDNKGDRLQHGYPSLFTSNEILHGISLSSSSEHHISHHNYCLQTVPEESIKETTPIIKEAAPIEGNNSYGAHTVGTQVPAPMEIDLDNTIPSDVESTDETIELSGQQDPPHLLKGLRNNLLTKDMKTFSAKSYHRKCCVSGCNSTNKTHRLFNIPKNDNLRELWLSFLIPNNVKLSGLSKEQLVNKFVCQNHFDRYQFDNKGDRLQHGYPSLFTSNEILHGISLRSSSHHNYCLQTVPEESIKETASIEGSAAPMAIDLDNAIPLEVESTDETIELSGQPLSVIYDSPHFPKGLRNNLLTKDMVFKENVTVLHHCNSIMLTVNLDTRINNNLTDHHVISDKIKKMKVNLAAQVFSAKTSMILKYTSLFATTASGDNVSPTMVTTGESVEFINNLFDSVNGSRRS